MKHKGAADTFRSVILIILLLIFLASYVALVNHDISKRIEINTREAEIMKLSNTLNLLKRSLAMTWYISTVQGVFHASDQSVLCGSDEPGTIGDALPPKYFYQFNRAQPKNIKDVIAYIEGRDSGSELAKYNRNEPFVCYPLDRDVEEILNFKFDTLTGIKERFEVNGIDVTIDRSSISAALSLTGEGVASNVRQKVSLASRSGKIDEEFASANVIYTRLKEMVSFSREVVRRLAGLSDSFADDSRSGFSDNIFNYLLRYQDLNTIKNPVIGYPCSNPPCDVKAGVYLSRITSQLDGAMKLGTSLKVSLDRNAELVAAGVDDAGVFNRDPSSFNDGSGLILHYDYSARIVEKGTAGDSSLCSETARSAYLEIIRRNVEAQNWEFDSKLVFEDMKFENEEIVQLVSGLMQRESSWNPDAVSVCGAAGLGQLMPGTAKQYGISNIYRDESFTGCNRMYANSLRSELQNNGNNAAAIDGRFDPELNIQASVRYVKFLLNYMIDRGQKDYTDDKEEALKLALAGYNAGPGRVDSAVSRASDSVPGFDRKNVRYDQIEQFLPDETRNYIIAVLGHFACYGGIVASTDALYYFHDESRNTFSKKSISMEVKAEDYLPAIDCTLGPYSVSGGLTTANERDFFNSVRFFSYSHNPGTCSNVRIAFTQPDGSAGEKVHNIFVGDTLCCGNVLWSCNADVPGLKVRDDGGTALSTNDVVNDRSTEASRLCDLDLARASRAGTTTTITCRETGFELIQRAGDSTNSCTLPPPSAAQCEDLGENECRGRGGCYYHGAANQCRTCAAAGSCSDYSGNEFACDQCTLTDGNSCASSYGGPTGDRHVCINA